MTSASVSSQEPPRIKAFRLALCKGIPKFPNNKASLQALQEKSLGSLLIDYFNWAIRYIPPRPRTVAVEPTVARDPQWTQLGAEIGVILRAAETGADLTPYLSLQPHTRGYTPAAAGTGPSTDRWADKDMLIIGMGYHHLHLDAAPTAEMRSNEVLFAYVTRDTFTVIGIFDHSVFVPTQAGAKMTDERARLWAAFDQHRMRDMPPGSVVMNPPISTSGHSVFLTFRAMKYARLICDTDPQLNDPTFVQDLYQKIYLPVPKKLKLGWHLQYLDLGLLDPAAKAFWNYIKGPI
jgi:hypothetical protein